MKMPQTPKQIESDAIYSNVQKGDATMFNQDSTNLQIIKALIGKPS